MEPGKAVCLFNCPRCNVTVRECLVTGSKQEHGVAVRDLRRRYPELHLLTVVAGSVDLQRDLWCRCPGEDVEHRIPAESPVGRREVTSHEARAALTAQGRTPVAGKGRAS